MTSLRWLVTAVVVAAGLGLQGCGDSPIEPDLPDVEMVAAGGDGQYGTPGQRLAAPLQVLVRRVDTGAHQAGLTVEWTVESGDASLVTTAVGTTDADGYAEAVVLLGSTPGTVTVRATLRERTGVSVALQAYVVERPSLSSLSTQLARGGDTLTLGGVGFSPTPDQNVVLFSGIRGRVITAAPTSMSVEVPACLPARVVSVTAQLGGLVSDALPLTVEDDGEVLDLGGGIPLDVQDDHGYTCLRVPGGGAPYLVLLESTGTVGAARYGFAFTGLTAPVGGVPTAPSRIAAHARWAPSGAQEAFEASLRRHEASLVRERPLGRSPEPVAPPASAEVPTVGDKRSFKVLNSQGQFDDVTAVARLVSAQAVFYVDEEAPAGGFTDSDLGRFAADFDEVIFPTDTAAFGSPSDLDANERVVILFTPTVNSLTPRGSAGFIGGFFYGLDLLDRDGSNHAEVFYGMVPDLAGQYSDVRSRDQVLSIMPAILAHEFQHMIHFNERVLKLGADGTEALWLSEGMAQMAEELVARAYLKRGDTFTADRYREGNRRRARDYLADASAVSLIVSTGQGSLAERGAGWLFTLYMWDRGGGDDVLRSLTRTTKTGTENVAAVMGTSWPDVFSDWAASLYLDGIGNRPYPFEYPSINLRDLLRSSGGYPLSPEVVGSEDFSRVGLLWSSSVQHYIVVPPASGSVALRLGGEAGGNAPGDAVFRFRIVRLY